ncbi:acyltransferase [Psychroflexus sp. CAK8W]|uniref:Acyltransferase n=1 Tax=Psychroflexus longus TaxID=2873596 RepID=A0ABS7XGS9_9FLAO|nr:acyltransferase [Psychroflexus longus]MBZ9777708.1 acyltransferase [Psychroflexus longus]
MTGREKFNKHKKIINLLWFFSRIFGISFNKFLFHFFRNTNGMVGIILRYIFAKNIFKYLGDNVSIHPNVFIFNHKNISIGNNVSIHPMCYIEGAGGIKIGDNVSIAHNSSLISTNHGWNDLQTPIKYNKESFQEILIENDVWVACGVRILAGVRVSERTVIAAGAVVNKGFEEKVLLAGIPAKIIKRI